MDGSFLEQVLALDKKIWYYVNVLGQNPFLDAITPFLRNQYFWAPLYIFLVVFMPMKFGKRGWIWCLFFLATFAISDYTSASLIKPMVQRLRPCNDPALKSVVHNIVGCGSGYSFPSSHAANHFAMALFMSVSLYRRYRWVMPATVIWAFSVSYSQVYVGVHFPLDVTCGGILGILTGMFTGWVNKKKWPLFPEAG